MDLDKQLNKIDSIRKNVSDSIGNDSLDIDTLISMVGERDDITDIARGIIDNNISPEFYHDFAFVYEIDKAMNYIKRNSITEDKFIKIKTGYCWNIANLDNLLDNDLDIDFFDKLSPLVELLPDYKLKTFFENCEMKDSKVEWNKDKNPIEVDDGLLIDSDIRLIEEFINNREFSVDDISSFFDLSKKHAIEYTTDSESEPIFRELKSDSFYSKFSDNQLKQLAIQQTIIPDEMKLGRSYEIEPEKIHAFVMAMENPKAFIDTVKTVGMRYDINRLVPLAKRDRKAFEKFAKGRQHSWGLANIMSSYLERSNDKAFAKMCEYTDIDSIVEKFLAMQTVSINQGLTFYEKKLMAYSVNTLSNNDKNRNRIVSNYDKIICDANEIFNCEKFKDLDIPEKINSILYSKNGRMKLVSTNDIESIALENPDDFYIKLKSAELHHTLSGLSNNNIRHIASRNNIKPESIISLLPDKDKYSIEDFKESLDLLVQNNKDKNLLRKYGIKKVSDSRIEVNRESSRFERDDPRIPIIMKMYPDSYTSRRMKDEKIKTSDHHEGIVAYIRAYIDRDSIYVTNLQTDIMDLKISSLKSKYSEWAKILMLSLEHFAIEAGYKSIKMACSDTEMRKWQHNHGGIHGSTAYNTYTIVPKEMGYSLTRSDLYREENCSDGVNLGGNFETIKYWQVSNIVWEKELNPQDKDSLDSIFLYRKSDKEKRENVLNQRVDFGIIKEKK